MGISFAGLQTVIRLLRVISLLAPATLYVVPAGVRADPGGPEAAGAAAPVVAAPVEAEAMTGMPGKWTVKSGDWNAGPAGWSLELPTADMSDQKPAIEVDDDAFFGDWELDLWISQTEPTATADYVLAVGPDASRQLRLKISPEFTRATVLCQNFCNGGTQLVFEDDVPSGGGPVQWIHIESNNDARRLVIWINGAPLDLKYPDFGIPPGPLRVTILKDGTTLTPSTLTLSGFQIAPVTGSSDTPVRGDAYGGWRTLAAPRPGDVTKDVYDYLSGIANDPAGSQVARANAAAALMILWRSRLGAVSPATWNDVASLCATGGLQDAPTLGLLLDTAVASADDGERAQAEPWVRRLVESQRTWSSSEPESVARREALVDPVDAIKTELTYPSIRLTRALTSNLSPLNSNLGLALYSGVLANENSSLKPVAWLLPEIGRVSPKFAQFSLDRLTRLAEHPDLFKTFGPVDQPLSLASYQLAPADPDKALDFALAIGNTLTRAQTLDKISSRLPAAYAGKALALVEPAFREAIAQWRPTKEDDSPVPEYGYLIDWLIRQNRTGDANIALNEAIGKIGRMPFTRFRDTWLITGLSVKLGRADVEAWWRRSIQEASAADKANGQPEYADGGIYFTASSIVARGLCGIGRFAEAEALIDKLDPIFYPDNKNAGYATIAHAMAATDIAGAIRVARKIDAGDARDRVLGELSITLFASDPKAAFDLLARVPEDDRIGPLAKIEASATGASADQAAGMLAEALPVVIQALPGPDSGAGARNLRDRLTILTPARLIPLAPAFGDHAGLYTDILLRATASACGLSADPLWKAISADDESSMYSIPWASSIDNALYAEKVDGDQP